MSDRDLRKLLRSRERAAADQLMVDQSLREHLSDDQANQVLEWGFDQLEAVVKTTAEMSDTAAKPTINKAVAGVKAVMLQVDELVHKFAITQDEDDAHKLYVKFLNELKSVTDVPAALYKESAQVAKARQKLGPDGIFNRVMDALKKS